MSYISITNVGTRHSDAIRGLNFYREEFKYMKIRLDEVASKNTSFEARQGLEHFQNQFDIQEKNIHDLKHKIDEHVQSMGYDAQSHQGRVNQEHKETERGLMDEYAQLEKVINEVRHEFNNFLSKWM